MQLLNYAHIYLLVFSVKCYGLRVKPEGVMKNELQCKRVIKEPYFETEMVVGKPWRIYYTWNMNLEGKCLDMVFKNATPSIVKRIWNDMNDYLEQQPVWDAATLYSTMGPSHHELLLFADQGPAGSFTAVTNVIRGEFLPIKNAVPLMKFVMKVVRQGKFLIMFDCHVGVGTMSARWNQRIYKSEIVSVAVEQNLGEGYFACDEGKASDEYLGIE